MGRELISAKGEGHSAIGTWWIESLVCGAIALGRSILDVIIAQKNAAKQAV
jgi:hypothetical protein